MRIGSIPEAPIEALGLLAGLVPTPLLDVLVSIQLARTVMVGTRLGIFEALAAAPATGAEVAARCATDPAATGKLLDALVGARYLAAARGRYALRPAARRWLLRASPRSQVDAVLFGYLEWRWVERYEDFVRTGRPVRMHQPGELDAQGWGDYQRGMRALASLFAAEVARRAPVPRGARDLLDVGGAHGLLSVELCRRHPALRAVVLDLPEAIVHAAPLLAREGMGDRVRHRAGDAVRDDLGEGCYDVVVISRLLHHFDAPTGQALVRRAARALRPGGVLVLHEVTRPATPGAAGQAGALADLYFALLSESGTWSFEELAAWQREAGLRPRRPIRLLGAPGAGLQVACRPRLEVGR